MRTLTQSAAKGFVESKICVQVRNFFYIRNKEAGQAFMKISSLAENIQIKLDEQKISVSEFERSAGLKRSAVANILAGKSKNPTLEVVISIANKLGCSIEELLDSVAPKDKGTRSININPKGPEEAQLFLDIGTLLLKKLGALGLEPSFPSFTNCFRETFFYATHGHKDRYQDEEFLSWIIKSHFPNPPVTQSV